MHLKIWVLIFLVVGPVTPLLSSGIIKRSEASGNVASKEELESLHYYLDRIAFNKYHSNEPEFAGSFSLRLGLTMPQPANSAGATSGNRLVGILEDIPLGESNTALTEISPLVAGDFNLIHTETGHGINLTGLWTASDNKMRILHDSEDTSIIANYTFDLANGETVTLIKSGAQYNHSHINGTATVTHRGLKWGSSGVRFDLGLGAHYLKTEKNFNYYNTDTNCYCHNYKQSNIMIGAVTRINYTISLWKGLFVMGSNEGHTLIDILETTHTLVQDDNNTVYNYANQVHNETSLTPFQSSRYGIGYHTRSKSGDFGLRIEVCYETETYLDTDSLGPKGGSEKQGSDLSNMGGSIAFIIDF